MWGGGGRKILGSEQAFSSVICRDGTRLVHRPSDLDVNWMFPVQGKSPPVQVKEPYGSLDMVYCIHSAILIVQSTPVDNTRKRVWQYIEKEKLTICKLQCTTRLDHGCRQNNLVLQNLNNNHNIVSFGRKLTQNKFKSPYSTAYHILYV